MGEQKVCLGAIASPHGVRGMVRIKPFTEEPENIGAYGPVNLADGRRFTLTVRSMAKGMVLATLDGITTREAAEELKGEQIFVDRNRLPQPEAEEIYHADLIGLEVMDPSIGVIGKITGIYDFGAGSMLEVRREKGKPVLLPFGNMSPITLETGGTERVSLNIDPIWLEDGAGDD